MSAAVGTTATIKRIEVPRGLKDLMRRLKLGKLLDTLPECLALAATQHLPHHDFFEMLFADEVARRDRQATVLRPRRPTRPGHGPRSNTEPGHSPLE